jgi:hypothetical protein
MSDDSPSELDILFEVKTPLGFSVRTTQAHWELIIMVKHPVMQNHLQAVQETLANPDEVRLSKTDPQVYLFYGENGSKRWVCAVTKRLEDSGFLITAYRTSAIKEGDLIWRK